MLNSNKSIQQDNQDDALQEQRKTPDRRISSDEIRLPFIDDDCRLVMKDRRSEDRRATDTKFKKHPLKKVSQLFKK